MGQQGRGKAQMDRWHKNHQKLEELLIQSGNRGMTEMELHKMSGLTRPTIDAHLRCFRDKREIVKEGRRFILKTSIALAEVMRTRMLKEAYKLMQKIKKDIEREIKDVKEHTTEKEFKGVVETELQGFLNTNCITFIGDVPCTFHKSMEGFQSHIAFENDLRQHHSRDLEGFREEFIRAHMKEDKTDRARVEARINEEVGWTVGDYFRKLLKKAEKEEGIRKIMTVLGITDEMLEEMGYTNRGQ